MMTIPKNLIPMMYGFPNKNGSHAGMRTIIDNPRRQDDSVLVAIVATTKATFLFLVPPLERTIRRMFCRATGFFSGFGKLRVGARMGRL
jgi:hypothetical protein